MSPRERAEKLHEDFRARLMRNEQPDIVDMLTEAIISMREEKAPACEEHPKYTGKRTPRSNCESCWRYYLDRKDREVC